MKNTLWKRVRGHGSGTRLVAAYLAVVFAVVTTGPGLALDLAPGETTATPEPVLVEPVPGEQVPAPSDPLVIPEEGTSDPAPSLLSSRMMLAAAPAAPKDTNTSTSWLQFANEVGSEQWIGGAVQQNKAVYSEGMSVPQRLIIEGISTPDAGHSVTFEHGFTKNGKYAYDFITSWSQARETASDVIGQTWPDSWQWMGVVSALKDSLDNHWVDVNIPTNGLASSQENAFEGALGYGNRTLRIYASEPITNAYVTMSPLSGSTADTSDFQFTVHWDSAADSVMILYASHIANGVDPYLPHTGIGWGAGMGAGNISGAPYHNRLASSTEWTGSKSEDNQLMASSVDAMSGITGRKFNDLDGDGTYPPEAGDVGLAGWEIWADLNNNGVYDVDVDATTTTIADDPATLAIDESGQYGLYFFLPDQSGASSVNLYEVQQDGWVKTYPTTAYHTVSVSPSQEVTGKDFGNWFDLQPLVEITKSADPSEVPETGGSVAFTFSISNTGPIAWTLTSLSDTKFGDLKDEAEAAWLADGKTLPVRLAVGESWSFDYTTTLSSDSLTAHYNMVTALVTDADGDTDDDADDETVTFDDIPPVIRVTKTATPTHIPEGGAYVKFTILVENIGPEDVTLTSLSDTVFGDLNGRGNLSLPQTILIGGSYSGEFNVSLASDDLIPHYNVVTATAVDDDGTTATDDDDATVTFDDTPPEITVTKTANPTSVPETGGDVTFTITVENTGDETVTLTGAIDTVFGPIDVAEFDKTVLAVGEIATYSFTERLASDSLTAHNNVVTVTAEDNDGTEDSDDDDATVEFEDILPLVSVAKSAGPVWMIMPGGTFHYTATVTNDSTERVQVVSVIDDVYGTIYEWDAEGEDPAIWLDPDESHDFYFEMLHSEPGVYPNTVTALVADNDGNEDSDEDSAEVVVTDPKIQITKTSDAPEGGIELGAPTLITYTYVVKNIGDVVLYNILVIDDKLGEIGTLDELAVGEEHTFTKSTTLSDGVTNVATATAIDEHENQVSDTDDEVVDSFLRFTELDLAITKLADRETAEPGDLVTYTLTYWNNGEKPASNFTIVDDFDERYVTIENAAGGVVAGGKITWTIPGPLTMADARKTITYSVRIINDIPDGKTNVDNVVVITDPDDADDSNDRATERVVVSEPFLPFTGAEYLLLLGLALAAAVIGLLLRLRVGGAA